MTNEMIKDLITEINHETLFEKFFTTNGRIDRMTFLKRNLILLLMFFLATVIIELCFFSYTLFGATLPDWTTAIYPCIMFAMLIPDYCLNTKRLQDLGKDSTLAKIFLGFGILSNIHYCVFPNAISETNPLILVEGFISLVFMAYLLFARGDENTNEYGDPK